MADRKSYDFNIAGLPYRLRSSHDEATVQELVSFVDSKLKLAITATKSGSFQSAAVLASLKRRALRELDSLEERTLKIAHNLDHSKVQKTGL